ncbi:MAG: PKD domain-containing protein [Bacteroidota bacterium]
MKYFLIFLILCLAAGKIFGQVFPHLVFQKFYDNMGTDIAKQIIKAQDGNLFIGGNTLLEAKQGQCSNIWIIKVDTLGDMIWEQEVVMSGCEELRDMVPTEDGGMVFTGVTSSLISHSERGDEAYWGDYLIGKMSENGTVEWLESYGGSSLDQANALAEGIYREFMIIGSSHSQDGDVGQNFGMSDLWALKIDTKGKRRFSKVVGGPKNEWGNDVTLCQNGDYLIAGFGNSKSRLGESPGMYGNGLIMRMTQTGKLVWQKTFPCPNGGYFTGVKETDTGEIIVIGNQHDGQLGYDFWWLILDANGNPKVKNLLQAPDDERFTCLDLCQDGGALFGGYSIHNGSEGSLVKGGDDFWLMRINEKGKLVWRQTYGGPYHERAAAILSYRPGVVYAVGNKVNRFTRAGRKADDDFWMLRIEEYPTDSIQAGIYVRAKDNRINRQVPTRFRAIHQYGERFFWDFGDGTTSTEEQPLKTYKLSGMYHVRLTIYANESCKETVELPELLEVW